MLVKDYCGKNAEQVIWSFDGALVATILDVLKQAAIEEGDWRKSGNRPTGSGGSIINIEFVTPRPQW